MGRRISNRKGLIRIEDCMCWMTARLYYVGRHVCWHWTRKSLFLLPFAVRERKCRTMKPQLRKRNEDLEQIASISNSGDCVCAKCHLPFKMSSEKFVLSLSHSFKSMTCGVGTFHRRYSCIYRVVFWFGSRSYSKFWYSGECWGGTKPTHFYRKLDLRSRKF